MTQEEIKSEMKSLGKIISKNRKKEDYIKYTLLPQIRKADKELKKLRQDIIEYYYIENGISDMPYETFNESGRTCKELLKKFNMKYLNLRQHHTPELRGVGKKINDLNLELQSMEDDRY